MKITILASAIAAMSMLIQHVDAAVCYTGQEGACPKGQECYSPKVEEGSPGVCAKTCISGTAKTCAKGFSCITPSGSLPGASGVCLSDTQCKVQTDAYKATQDKIGTMMVAVYNTILDSFYQGLFKQVVNGEAPTGDCAPSMNQTCAAGEFCLFEPGASPVDLTGKCYKYVAGDGFCLTGVQGSCTGTDVCIAPPNAPPGAVGKCIPKNAKVCYLGTAKPCAKGFYCQAPPDAPIGAQGYCIKEDPCWGPSTYDNYLQYWQFENARTSFEYDLGDSQRDAVKAKVNGN